MSILHKKTVLCCLGLTALLAAVLLCVLLPRQRTEPVETTEQAHTLSEILDASGHGRTVEQDEFAFFYGIVRRDSANRGDEAALREETRTLIREQSAMFLTAQLAGLCQPYSFERLQQDMEQENAKRAEMKAAGERFYGLERFDLNSYYDYTTSNLRLSLLEYLAGQATEEMKAGARQYYEDHLSDYQTIGTAVYLREQDGNTETVSLSFSEMRTLMNVNEELFEFLLTARPGDRLTQSGQNGTVLITFESLEMLTASFEDAYGTVMQDYIANECYGDILSTVSDNNPVIFEEAAD